MHTIVVCARLHKTHDYTHGSIFTVALVSSGCAASVQFLLVPYTYIAPMNFDCPFNIFFHARYLCSIYDFDLWRYEGI